MKEWAVRDIHILTWGGRGEGHVHKDPELSKNKSTNRVLNMDERR